MSVTICLWLLLLLLLLLLYCHIQHHLITFSCLQCISWSDFKRNISTAKRQHPIQYNLKTPEINLSWINWISHQFLKMSCNVQHARKILISKVTNSHCSPLYSCQIISWQCIKQIQTCMDLPLCPSHAKLVSGAFSRSWEITSMQKLNYSYFSKIHKIERENRQASFTSHHIYSSHALKFRLFVDH